MQHENVRQFAPHRQIFNFQTELRYRSKFAVHSQQMGMPRFYCLTVYFDLIETQIKATVAKQLNCYEKGQKASRLKCLRNRDGQKKCSVIFKYSFRT